MQELFDRPEDYDAMLQQGIALTGNDRKFFIEGRLNFLLSQVGNRSSIHKILDYGCGTGETTLALAEAFPNAEVWGADVSESAVAWARKKYQKPNLQYCTDAGLAEAHFDLIYLNGVLHHIPVSERQKAMDFLFRLCAAGGSLWLFENNPLNPGTQWAMFANPFDKGVVKVWPAQAKSFFRNAGFRVRNTTFHFYFPQWLSLFRPLEVYFRDIPLGGQYCVTGTRPM